MRDTLIIRLRGEDAEALDWCRFTTAGEAGIGTAPLAEILTQCAGHRVVLLVPGIDVVLTQAHLPVRQMHKLVQAVPFALEDQLAEDIDNLHFPLGARTPDGGVAVAVVARQRMDEWLAPFLDAGIQPEAVHPDTLCLPLPPADAEPAPWTVLIEPGRALVRSGRDAGFACEADLLPSLLRRATVSEAPAFRVHVAPGARAPGDLPDGAETAAAPADAFRLLLDGLAQRTPLNLLQGTYATSSGTIRHWRAWRATAALAAVLLVAWLAAQGVTAYQLSRQADALNAEATRVFQQTFPDIERIVDMRAQGEQALSRLTRSASGHSGFLFLLARSAQALAKTPGITVDQIEYRDDRLDLSLKGNNLQSLENLRNRFRGQKELMLEVQSANSDSMGVQIRVSVRRREAGAT